MRFPSSKGNGSSRSSKKLSGNIRPSEYTGPRPACSMFRCASSNRMNMHHLQQHGSHWHGPYLPLQASRRELMHPSLLFSKQLKQIVPFPRVLKSCGHAKGTLNDRCTGRSFNVRCFPVIIAHRPVPPVSYLCPSLVSMEFGMYRPEVLGVVLPGSFVKMSRLKAKWTVAQVIDLLALRHLGTPRLFKCHNVNISAFQHPVTVSCQAPAPN